MGVLTAEYRWTESAGLMETVVWWAVLVFHLAASLSGRMVFALTCSLSVL